MGPAWDADWFDLVMAFSGLDVQFNFAELVSWQGVDQALFGDGNRFAVVLGWSFSVATIVALSWVWFRGGREDDFSAQLGLASVAIVLISPHTLFYDGGIALHAAIKDGRITVVEVVQHYTDRVRAYNGVCSMLVTEDGRLQ